MTINFKKNLLILLYFFAISVLVSIIKFDFPQSLWTDFIWSFDGLSTQVQVQAIIKSGPFLSTDHLGYPFGFSHWTVPQFGLIHVIFIWLLSNSINVSAFGILVIYGIIVLALNGFSIYVLMMQISKLKYFSIVIGTVFLLIPYAINQLARPHVMSLYFFPALLYYIINQGGKSFFHKKSFLLLTTIFLSISIFWSFTIIFIFVPLVTVLIVIKALGIKFNDRYFRSIMLAFLAVAIGLVSNLILFQFNSHLRGEEDRFPWQSDIFAGKLSDLFVSSPFLNLSFPKLATFTEGTSFEATHLHLGLFFILLFFFALLSVIYSTVINNTSTEIRIVSVLALIILLYFFVGGFSNLQAGVFNFFGIVTPMRSWARLSILISICGLVLMTYLLIHLNKNYLFQIISIFAIFFAVLDFSYSKSNLVLSNNFKEQEEYGSMAFLSENFKPCPVLQLPIDTFVLPQGWLDNAERYYWSQIKPFVILPDFYWTGGTYTESPGWQELKLINSTVTEKDFDNFSVKYCAVLFDKDFSKYQTERKATLKGSVDGWPGLIISDSLAPDYEDYRYRIYDLR